MQPIATPQHDDAPPTVPPTVTPEQVAAMAAAIQAGADEVAAIEAIKAKMAKGGLDPERGDLCIAPKAWAAVIKNPPPWLSFSVFLTDKPIMTPASHLLDLNR